MQPLEHQTIQLTGISVDRWKGLAAEGLDCTRSHGSAAQLLLFLDAWQKRTLCRQRQRREEPIGPPIGHGAEDHPVRRDDARPIRKAGEGSHDVRDLATSYLISPIDDPDARDAILKEIVQSPCVFGDVPSGDLEKSAGGVWPASLD